MTTADYINRLYVQADNLAALIRNAADSADCRTPYGKTLWHAWTATANLTALLYQAAAAATDMEDEEAAACQKKA